MLRPAVLDKRNDHILIAAAQDGDRQAFGELVCRYHSGLVNVVYRMCGNQDLAEEAVQEAFIRSWRRLYQYNPQYPIRNWLYRIAINIVLDLLRQDRGEIDIQNLELEGNAPTPDRLLEEKETAQAVRTAVLALPPASRSVLVLREYEGLSYQEISETLQIPLGTVMSRLNYARGRLRKELAGYMEMS
jgi:RNA polymerase sigma-70 factor, ECF subfamily